MKTFFVKTTPVFSGITAFIYRAIFWYLLRMEKDGTGAPTHFNQGYYFAPVDDKTRIFLQNEGQVNCDGLIKFSPLWLKGTDRNFYLCYYNAFFQRFIELRNEVFTFEYRQELNEALKFPGVITSSVLRVFDENPLKVYDTATPLKWARHIESKWDEVTNGLKRPDCINSRYYVYGYSDNGPAKFGHPIYVPAVFFNRHFPRPEIYSTRIGTSFLIAYWNAYTDEIEICFEGIKKTVQAEAKDEETGAPLFVALLGDLITANLERHRKGLIK